MSNCVIFNASMPLASRPLMSKALLAVEENGRSFVVSSHVASRVVYPSHLISLESYDAYFPLSRFQVAEAVYENVVGFLDNLSKDEVFCSEI